MIYDRTCRGRYALPGLTATWRAGAGLYRALDRIDAWHGAGSWAEALEWAANIEPGSAIREIQFWGHGRWGCAKIDRDVLDARSLEPDHPLYSALSKIRDRLAPGGEALWWFRTCETFGTKVGQDFARAWSRFFGCRVAGHTYVIWLAQSGLHTLRPHEEPTWPVDEGLPPHGGTGPTKALWSTPLAPNTISCFSGTIPEGF
jgi:hypothetical protein